MWKNGNKKQYFQTFESKIHERKMSQINKEQQEKNYDLLLEKYTKLRKQLKEIYMNQ